MSEPADDPSEVSIRAVRAAVSAALRGDESDMDVLGRVGRACVQLLPVDGASVSVNDGTAHHETLYASDEVSARVESTQFTLGEGPSFEALRTRGPVLLPDLTGTRAAAWPIFRGEMADLPVSALFAFPIQSGAIVVGVLTLYRRQIGPLDPDELAVALQVADLAVVLLLHLGVLATDDAHGHDYEDWLSQLPSSTAEVHQATGMLIAQLGISAAQALARLRGHAFASGRLVEDLARDVIARRVNLADPDT